jgi:hypothetical protein
MQFAKVGGRMTDLTPLEAALSPLFSGRARSRQGAPILGWRMKFLILLIAVISQNYLAADANIQGIDLPYAI